MTDSDRIWLVRHGETEWSRTKRHTGTTDVPLTAEGERQARALGGLLAAERFALVLTSPRRRAADTSRLAGLGAAAHVLPDLAEWDYGEYEGRTSSEIQREVPGWTIWTHPVPGGEAAEDVGARADRVLAAAAGAPGDAVLFAHGHVLRVLAARWLGLPPRAGQLFALDTGSLSILGREHGARVLSLWNRVP